MEFKYHVTELHAENLAVHLAFIMAGFGSRNKKQTTTTLCRQDFKSKEDSEQISLEGNFQKRHSAKLLRL